MYGIDFEKPRIAFVRNMARKAFDECSVIFQEGFPSDMGKAIGTILPGFKIVMLSQMPKGSSAITIVSDKLIGVNEKHHIHRQRFSIGHELGHIYLCHPHDVFDPENEKDKILEDEADIFSAEFLVPLKTIKSEFKSCRDFQILAKKFMVSSQTMYIRFKEARLLSQIL